VPLLAALSASGMLRDAGHGGTTSAPPASPSAATSSPNLLNHSGPQPAIAPLGYGRWWPHPVRRQLRVAESSAVPT